MEFVHRHNRPGETIAAIATPPGEGGISIIRISGDEAIAVADRIFSGDVSSYASHTAHLGTVQTVEGEAIDQALLLVMRAPNSYTGEETVELQCHGGMVSSRRVLEAAISAGARLAEAGEFTFKAFMNGKLDLAQAEAVQHLIGAKNHKAFSVAQSHLEGKLSSEVRLFQQRLTHLAAILEAWVDFPDEGLEFISQEELISQLHEEQKAIEALSSTFEDGKKIECGITLCIAGPPNAGKSSLMNALLKKERAIVTPIAGTTRDLLQEEMTIGGLHFHLTDTAGIRETEEVIEKEGISRSKKAMEEADLVLYVLDGTAPELNLEGIPQKKSLIVWNKIDSDDVKPVPLPEAVQISAKNGKGLEELKARIEQKIWEKGAPAKDQVVITSLRHKEALSSASVHLHRVIDGLGRESSPEFVAADMRGALAELGSVIGTNIHEDILSSIFSQFCIGK